MKGLEKTIAGYVHGGDNPRALIEIANRIRWQFDPSNLHQIAEGILKGADSENEKISRYSEEYKARATAVAGLGLAAVTQAVTQLTGRDLEMRERVGKDGAQKFISELGIGSYNESAVPLGWELSDREHRTGPLHQGLEVYRGCAVECLRAKIDYLRDTAHGLNLTPEQTKELSGRIFYIRENIKPKNLFRSAGYHSRILEGFDEILMWLSSGVIPSQEGNSEGMTPDRTMVLWQNCSYALAIASGSHENLSFGIYTAITGSIDGPKKEVALNDTLYAFWVAGSKYNLDCFDSGRFDLFRLAALPKTKDMKLLLNPTGQA